MKYVVIRNLNFDLRDCIGIYDDYKTALGQVYSELYDMLHDEDTGKLKNDYKLETEWYHDNSYDSYDYWEVTREYNKKINTELELWIYYYKDDAE